MFDFQLKAGHIFLDIGLLMKIILCELVGLTKYGNAIQLGTYKKSHRIDINLFIAISIWMSTRK
jgi:hypothetical protein